MAIGCVAKRNNSLRRSYTFPSFKPRGHRNSAAVPEAKAWQKARDTLLRLYRMTPRTKECYLAPHRARSFPSSLASSQFPPIHCSFHHPLVHSPFRSIPFTVHAARRLACSFIRVLLRTMYTFTALWHTAGSKETYRYIMLRCPL